jgi:hypothetical protein
MSSPKRVADARRHTVLQHDLSKSFAFVLCTEPGQAMSPATRRMIKKHAMKDIEKSRRHKKQGSSSYGFLVTQPGTGTACTTASVESTPRLRSRSKIGEECDSANSPENLNNSFKEFQTGGHPLEWDAILSAPISRMWAGRIDYFKNYPIEMNMHHHGLLDHS